MSTSSHASPELFFVTFCTISELEAISTGVSVQESRYNTVTMGADETYVGECRGGLRDGWGKVTLPNGTEHEGQWIGGELRIKTNKEMPVDPVQVNTSSYVSSIIQLVRSFSGCASRNRTSTADILRPSLKGSSAMRQEHEGQWTEGNLKTNTNKEERDRTSTADILRPSLKGSSALKQQRDVESSLIPVGELQDSESAAVTCLCFGQERLHKVRF